MLKASNADKVTSKWGYANGYPHEIRTYTFANGETRFVGFVKDTPICAGSCEQTVREATGAFAATEQFLTDRYRTSLGVVLYRINLEHGRGDVIPESIRCVKDLPDGSCLGEVTVQLQYGQRTYKWVWSADRKYVTFRGKKRGVFTLPKSYRLSLNNL